ncbi:hypothetical protein RIR_jg42323.t1 [Rhizophagus irregularis DAOM 181602=DAOM 197198]|nr:hypothetical protein RIR_jg42323.t1 [Rhizophagus irregularis DAOM 181602=DAOM 197198]
MNLTTIPFLFEISLYLGLKKSPGIPNSKNQYQTKFVFSSYLNGIMNFEIRFFCHFSFKFSSQLNSFKKDTIKYSKIRQIK